MHFDLAVIGWGKAGKSLAADMAAAGKRVVLIERSSSMYGGTCINIGCVPTKDLLVSAEKRRHSDNPSGYFASAVAERDALISALRAANYRMLEGKVTLIDGHASLVDEHTIRVEAVESKGSESTEAIELTADTIVINTGTVSRKLDIPGIDNPGVYDSTSIQHAQPFPARLGIIGAGFIGLEFATMFAEFGSEVTVIDPGSVFVPRLDRDVAESLHSTLSSQGVTVHLGQQATQIERIDSFLRIHTEGDPLDVDAVLVAVGRVPATDNLGLDKAGVETNDRGFITVDDQLRTSVPHIFAVGDVNGGPQFTYVSYDDYRIVKDALTGEGTRRRSDREAMPWTTFTQPPLSVVGMSESDALSAGIAIETVTVPIAQIPVMPRPKILGNTAGVMKFVVDASTQKVLGAALHCVDSQELINMVALLMRLGGTVADLRDGMWTHPSSTEAFNGVLRALAPVTTS